MCYLKIQSVLNAALVALLLMIFSLNGCATAEYSAYEGSRTLNGRGGAKKNVNGMEVWTEGTPPKRYKIIGIITTSDGHSAAVNEARKYDADALILIDKYTYYTGTTTNTTVNHDNSYSTATTQSTANYRTNYKYHAIEYK